MNLVKVVKNDLFQYSLLSLLFVIIIIFLLRKHFFQNPRANERGNGHVYLTINNVHINMNRDLTEVAPQIQQLVEQLQSQGITEVAAQNQIAKDIASQAQNNPTIREKLDNLGKIFGKFPH